MMYVIVHHLAVSLTERFTGDAIMGFQLTLESARRTIAQADESLELLAFATIIKNGENGKGITSRWYPETLRRRILAIASVRY